MLHGGPYSNSFWVGVWAGRDQHSVCVTSNHDLHIAVANKPFKVSIKEIFWDYLYVEYIKLIALNPDRVESNEIRNLLFEHW